MNVWVDEMDEAVGTPALEIAEAWVEELNTALAAADPAPLAALFVADCWWRDVLTFTWDVQTFRGQARLEALAASIGVGVTARVDLAPERMPRTGRTAGAETVEAFLTWDTDVFRAEGFLRLRREGSGYLGWTVSSVAQEIKGHEERRTRIADLEQPEFNTAILGRPTWYERRARARAFEDEEPTVLIIGAGHSGVMLAARLQHLGVSHLIVDREERLGDNWRMRYAGLNLHDTAWYSRFPYLDYPDNWPVCSPAELLGDWIESYVNLLQLNAWTEAEVTSARFVSGTEEWEVAVTRPCGERVLRPKHVVFATGLFGKARMPAIPGREVFTGELVHSSAFTGGTACQGVRAVVLGAGASGHDVAQILFEAGASSVTLVQRGDTYVMSVTRGLPLFMEGMWDGEGPPLEVADLLAVSTSPSFAIEVTAPETTARIAVADRDLLTDLERVGFGVTLGRGNSGMLGSSIYRDRGYYIDKGCSRLLTSGRVALRRGEVQELRERSIVFADGSEQPVDVVVCATGWDNMREATRPICGDEVADGLTDVWGLDDDGELKGVFRRSGHPRLWFVSGPIATVRSHSKALALQILGVELGLVEP